MNCCTHLTINEVHETELVVLVVTLIRVCDGHRKYNKKQPEYSDNDIDDKDPAAVVEKAADTRPKCA